MPLNHHILTENDGEIGKILMRDFMPPHRTGYMKYGPNDVILPKSYLKFADDIENFEVRDDDVWVMSHPKTGTTWTQEMVWCIANNLDFDGAKEMLFNRFPFIEVTTLFDFEVTAQQNPEKPIEECMKDSVKYCNQFKSPRFIKTHLPWHLLPKQIRENIKKPKIVYVCRNAKDTCLSYYHHCKFMEGYEGSFDDFVKLFLQGGVTYTPFWPHILEYWEHRDQSNVLFIRFEDMKKDLPSVIRLTADFLGKTLTESQIEILTDHLSFAKMKVNPAVNYEEVTDGSKFMRKGEVGQWKADMTPEVIKQFDVWTKQQIEGKGLPYSS